MRLDEARAKLAAVLAPVADDDPNVLVNLVDTVDPPALMIGWGEPWLEPRTSCIYTARIAITLIGARLVPGVGVEQLEALAQYVVDRIKSDPGTWPIEDLSQPLIFTMGKTSYLGARLTITIPIT